MKKKYEVNNYGHPVMPGKFFVLPNDIFEKGLTNKELVVLAYLVRCKDLNNQCWPSRATIADNTDTKSVRTIDHCLKVLEDRGFIQKVNRYDYDQHQRLSSVYIINKFE